ncbi:ATP-binding cassette domain-containing protein [Kiritimatiellota bacterium B12222]|nr:ATP-binding cassette domain-containing protein [Kiritimatiellota bacterium B12222]
MKLHRWEALGDKVILSSLGVITDAPSEKHVDLRVQVEWLSDQASAFRVEKISGPEGVYPYINQIAFEGQNEIRGVPFLRIHDKHFRLSAQGVWEDVAGPLGLQVHGLGLQREEHMVLDEVHLTVKPGQLVGVMGPSGCGKSTFIRCLLGELIPDQGHLVYSNYHGQGIEDPELGYVPQDNQLYPYLTVEETLQYMNRLRKDAQEADIQDLLEQVELTDLRQQLVSQLSGGEAKRLNVAVELLHLPQVLILDEPTSGLDPRIQDRLMDQLREIAHSGTTVLCVTHDLSLVRKLDHLLILRSLRNQIDCGSCVYQGEPSGLSPADLLESYGPDCRWTVAPSTADFQNLQDAFSGDKGFAPFRWSQLGTVCGRSWKRLIRNPAHLGMSLALAPLLAFLILLSQLRPGNPGYASVLLFSTIALLWLAMNFGVRELVSERNLFQRDLRSGLSPGAYLWGKIGFVLQVASLQMILFLATFALLSTFSWGELQLAGQLLSKEMLYAASGTLLLLGWTGGLIGLMISAVCRSEALAVTLVPLLLIPHLLFNRIGYHGASTLEAQAHLYGPIPDGFSLSALREIDPEFNEVEFTIHSLGSAGLISRPALTILMYAGKGKSVELPEKIYIMGLFSLQMFLTVYLFFRTLESAAMTSPKLVEKRHA